MKTSCPIFSLALWMGMALATQAQTPARVAGQGGRAAADTAPSGNQDPQAIVERVERNIDQLSSLSAKVRTKIDLFDQQASGAGLYRQQRDGSRQFSRFELKSQLGDATLTLLQVNDGRYFWTFRELPDRDLPTVASLSRLDLERIQDQLQSGRQPNPTAPGQLPIGGLPKLLAGLRESFQFGQLGEIQLAERRGWVVDGQWRPAQLAAAVPDQRTTIEAGRSIDLKKLPAHLPEHVVLYIGQSDLLLYRIEYLRRSDKSSGEGQGGILPGYRAMMTMDFFDMKPNQPIDPREFVYQPSRKWTDTTDAYLKSLGTAAAK